MLSKSSNSQVCQELPHSPPTNLCGRQPHRTAVRLKRPTHPRDLCRPGTHQGMCLNWIQQHPNLFEEAGSYLQQGLLCCSSLQGPHSDDTSSSIYSIHTKCPSRIQFMLKIKRFNQFIHWIVSRNVWISTANTIYRQPVDFCSQRYAK